MATEIGWLQSEKMQFKKILVVLAGNLLLGISTSFGKVSAIPWCE